MFNFFKRLFNKNIDNSVLLNKEINTLKKIISLKDKEIMQKDEKIALITAEYNLNSEDVNLKEESAVENFKVDVYNSVKQLLINYPKAIDSISKNSELKAKDMIGILKPLEALIELIDLERIGNIGEIVEFDITIHNAINCDIKTGSKAEIISFGYKNGSIILTKAGVKEVY